LSATEVLLEIVGGVALLLWGVRMIRTGVSRAMGASLRGLIRRTAGNRFSAFGAGLLITVPLQSSTATAIIVSAFAAKRMILITAALAVMLGADVGTAVAAQILALDLRWLSPLMITGGFILFLAGRSARARQFGRAAIGVGLVMLALRLIVSASEPLRDSPALAAVLTSLEAERLLTALVAALLTWLSHSSISVILTISALTSAGVVPLAVALPFVLGANVGGAVAPLVASAPNGNVGRQPPLGNLVMRGIGAATALALLPWLAPLAGTYLGSGGQLVLNVHLAFNIALALVMLPFLGPLAALVGRILPDRPSSEESLARPRYLDEDALETPAVALANASREALRMGDFVDSMLRRTIEVFRHDDAELAARIEAEDDIVDNLHEAIKLYLTRLSQSELEEEEGQRYVELLTFTTNLEHIGDIVDRNLMELAAKKIKGGLRFSDEGFAEIETFHRRIVDNLQLAFGVFMSEDVELARRLIEQKAVVRSLEARAIENHLTRIGERLPESVETSSLHLDVIRDFKRINSHLTAVAYPLLERAGVLRPSRLRERDDASVTVAEREA